MISIPLILLCFVSGFSFLLTKSTWSVLLLMVNYLFQAIQFKFNGLYYFFAVGPYLGFGFVRKGNEDISFWWDISEFIGIILIRFVNDKIGYFLTFNFVAILFFVILLLEYRNRKGNCA